MTASPKAQLLFVFLAGLATGIGIGWFSAPRAQTEVDARHIVEYVSEARHVNFASDVREFDVHYPHTYKQPPELTILTEEMNHGFDYQLVDQRADGFRIKIGSSMKRADKPNGSPWLRYRAKGILADRKASS